MLSLADKLKIIEKIKKCKILAVQFRVGASTISDMLKKMKGMYKTVCYF